MKLLQVIASDTFTGGSPATAILQCPSFLQKSERGKQRGLKIALPRGMQAEPG
jgi:hypothetical protein